MIVDDFIAALGAIEPAAFALVQGVGELAQVKDAPAAVPAAYVFIEAEAASDNTRLNGLLQRVEADIGVVIVARNVSDNAGGAASRDVEALKRQVIQALAGTQPPGVEDTVTYVGGHLVRARNGYVWWQLTFGAAYYLKEK